MINKTLQLILVSNPGLFCNSLLSYYRSLGVDQIQTIGFKNSDFFSTVHPEAVDGIIILEEDNLEEVEDFLGLPFLATFQVGVFVRDMRRQHELKKKTKACVWVWGFDDPVIHPIIYTEQSGDYI